VVVGEDIRCRSDLVTGHNSFRAQVDNSDKSVAKVKRTLRVFNRFYFRFVQVITICVCVYVCMCIVVVKLPSDVLFYEYLDVL
jgi:hypothetical protein